MDDAKTVWCGNLADQVTEELLYELFLQVAPLERVKIPTDREGRKSNFGFITFKHEVSVPYAVELLNGITMFEKRLNVKPRNGGTQQDRQNVQQNVQQNAIQRSFSYPNDAYNQIRQNQHQRFTDPADINPQYISYDSLIQLGQLMNVNYDFAENNYGNHYGGNHGHNSGNNHGNNRQQWERNSFREKDKDRDRKEYDRPRHDYERGRDRRNDHHNSRNHNRRNDDRNNQNYDRNGGRKHRRHF